MNTEQKTRDESELISNALLDKMRALPKWKCFIITQVLRRKKWKSARAYNRVYCHLVNSEGMYGEPIAEEMLERGEKAWLEVYANFI